MLRFDRERALGALPRLLPTEEERREAVEIVRRIRYADGEIRPEGEAMLEEVERILELDKPAPRQTGRRASRGSTAPAAAE